MPATMSSNFAPVSRPRKSNHRETYLLFYNLLSCFAWAWVLDRVVFELFFTPSTPTSIDAPFSTPNFDPLPITTRRYRSFASEERRSRAGQIEGKIGKSIKLIQSCAALEILHSLFKLVRSGALTTLMQVSSRLWIVLVIMPTFPQLGKSPIYTSMVLAWSFTEVIRYAHYACSLAQIHSDLLGWLRYSTFYILYPIGAGSEAAVMLLAFRAARAAHLSPTITYTILSLVCLWPPALAVMMKHMSHQRKKYLKQTKTTHVS